MQVAFLDALTLEEELELMALDETTHEAETCVLQVSDRILHDLGEDEGGFYAGCVLRLEDDGRLCIQLDGHKQQVPSGMNVTCHILETHAMLTGPEAYRP